MALQQQVVGLQQQPLRQEQQKIEKKRPAAAAAAAGGGGGAAAAAAAGQEGPHAAAQRRKLFEKCVRVDQMLWALVDRWTAGRIRSTDARIPLPSHSHRWASALARQARKEKFHDGSRNEIRKIVIKEGKAMLQVRWVCCSKAKAIIETKIIIIFIRLIGMSFLKEVRGCVEGEKAGQRQEKKCTDVPVVFDSLFFLSFSSLLAGRRPLRRLPLPFHSIPSPSKPHHKHVVVVGYLLVGTEAAEAGQLALVVHAAVVRALVLAGALVVCVGGGGAKCVEENEPERFTEPKILSF